METKEAVETPETALVPATAETAIAEPINVAALMEENAGDAQDFGADIALPFLVVLQPNSPQCTEGHAKFVEGARPGMILNTVTKEYFRTTRGVVSAYAKTAVEWRPNRGGFVGQHLLESKTYKEAKKVTDANGKTVLRAANGNELSETAYYYFTNIGAEPAEGKQPDQPSWGVFGLTSTQLKVSRNLNTVISDTTFPTADDKGRFKPPMYGIVFKVSTKLETNDKGSWYSLVFEPLGPVTILPNAQEVFVYAKAFSEHVRNGVVHATAPPEAEEGTTEAAPF